MSIKEKIHVLIEKVEDDELLQRICSMVEHVIDTEDENENLTEEQIRRIEVSRQSIREGRTHSWEIVREEK